MKDTKEFGWNMNVRLVDPENIIWKSTAISSIVRAEGLLNRCYNALVALQDGAELEEVDIEELIGDIEEFLA